MRLGRKGNSVDLQGSDSEVETTAGASRLIRFPRAAKSHRRMPPTYESAPGASHDPSLYYDVLDEDGTLKRYFETHPGGNRKQRRYRRRHSPQFTKKATGGRDWQVLQKSRQEELDEHS